MSRGNKNDVEIDYNVKEILDNLDKARVLTAEDKKRIEESLDFDKAINGIDISDNDNRVIFTDGDRQLVFEDGEFFLVSSTDSLKTKEKKKRDEARNMYIEYFIKYQLNPILNQRKIDAIACTIEPINKQQSKEKIGKELGSRIKGMPDKESDKLSREKSNDTRVR